MSQTHPKIHRHIYLLGTTTGLSQTHPKIHRHIYIQGYLQVCHKLILKYIGIFTYWDTGITTGLSQTHPKILRYYLLTGITTDTACKE